MKQLIKFGLVMLSLLLATIGSVVVMYAAGDHGGPGRPGGPGGHGSERGRGRFGGEVTAVTSESVSVVGYGRPTGGNPIRPGHGISPTHPISQTGAITRVAHFTDSTAVKLVECQCAGTLADLTVGDHIDVKGVRMSDETYVVLTITIAPDGDKLGGKVTAVDGLVISVKSRGNLSGTIVTDASTKFLTRDGTATLADVTAGTRIAGYGVAQEDGSLLARVVLIQGGRPHSIATADATSADMTITIDSAAVDALVNNLASDDDQPVEVTTTRAVFLPLIR